MDSIVRLVGLYCSPERAPTLFSRDDKGRGRQFHHRAHRRHRGSVGRLIMPPREHPILWRTLVEGGYGTYPALTLTHTLSSRPLCESRIGSRAFRRDSLLPERVGVDDPLAACDRR